MVTYLIQFAFIFGVCYLLYSKASEAREAESIVSEGGEECIPEFLFKTIDGQDFTTQELIDGSVYLIIYFNSECPDCIRELKLIDKYYEKFVNAHIVFVSLQSPQDLLDLKMRYELFSYENVDLLIDQNHVFGNLFNTSSYPTMFIYDQDKGLVERLDDPVGIKTLIKIIIFANSDSEKS